MVGALSSLVALQALTRVVNFALTTALARVLGPAAIGLANVNLQLVSASALFLSKEGLRRAGQRVYPGGDGAPLVHGSNLVWLAVPLTALSALVVGWSTSWSAAATAELLPPADYMRTVSLFCVAAVLEACAEPAWLYAQSNALIPTRAAAEGGALLLKAAATAYFVLIADGAAGAAFAFGVAQLLYAAAYLALLLALLEWRSGGGLLSALRPRLAVSAADADGTAAIWLPRAHREAGMLQCWQAVQKYALTEGERLVLVSLASLHDQGVFGLVSNLGSLVARMLLQPVEEM